MYYKFYFINLANAIYYSANITFTAIQVLCWAIRGKKINVSVEKDFR